MDKRAENGEGLNYRHGGRRDGDFRAQLKGNGAVEQQEPSRLIIAIAWVKARRARDRAFGPDLFSDPAWDILLDLYINFRRQRVCCVSDLFHGSPSPPTTIIRWITTLENRGLVRRQPDRNDKRRLLVSLTDTGLGQMEKALDLALESDKNLGLGRLRLVE